MRKLALLTLPLLLAAGPVLAQQSLTPHSGFNNQTGNAQNASRLSGLHTDSSQVHQMDTNAANSMGANGGTSDPAFPDRLTTSTAPPSQGGALPLAGQPAPGATGGGMPANGNTPAAPR